MTVPIPWEEISFALRKYYLNYLAYLDVSCGSQLKSKQPAKVGDYLDVTVLGRGWRCDVLPLLLLTDSIKGSYHLVRRAPCSLETCYKINEREYTWVGGCIFVPVRDCKSCCWQRVGSLGRRIDI